MFPEEEKGFFRQKKEEWLRQGWENKFVVIVDNNKFIGPFETELEASEAGVKNFGMREMLVEEISQTEPVCVFFLID